MSDNHIRQLQKSQPSTYEIKPNNNNKLVRPMSFNPHNFDHTIFFHTLHPFDKNYLYKVINTQKKKESGNNVEDQKTRNFETDTN